MGVGPLGTGSNSPVSDPGTLTRGASPYPGPVCQATHPNNILSVRQWARDVAALCGEAELAIESMQSGLPGLSEADRANAQDDIDRANVDMRTMVCRFNNVCDGLDRDSEAFARSYDHFESVVVVLHLGNDRINAGRALGPRGVAREVLQMLEMLQGKLDEEALKAAKDLVNELEELRRLLERAKSNVKQAQAQVAINAALFAVFKTLEAAVPAVTAMEIAFRCAAFTLSVMSVDRMLGPGSDPWADLDVAAGGLLEALPETVCRALTHHRKQLAGRLSALGTLVFDVKEVLEAQHIVEEIKNDLERAGKHLDRLNDWIAKNRWRLPLLRSAVRKLEETWPALVSHATEVNENYWYYKNRLTAP